MKTAVKFACLLVLGAVLAVSGCAKKHFTNWNYIKSPDVATQLKSFVAGKMAQANSATNESPPEFAAFFAAAQNGDWLTVSNSFNEFAKHAPQYQHSGTNDARLSGTAWAAILEIWGAFDAFGEGNQKYSALYANDIINSIPPGSVYFGGTDEGRFLITAMQKSQVDGDPFFTITQNALADGSYLDYLQNMYGDQLYIPTAEDSQQCFQEYTDDAKLRLQNHQLKPGEHVKMDPSGRPQISGQVAVMEINGLIAKVIFDKNTSRDFYIQESFPLDWMYPYLEPHGLIFKIDHQPLAALSDETIQQDHDYWTKAIAPMIGDWLNDDTTIKEIAAFGEKVFLQHDFSGFTGDQRFVENKYAGAAFSWDRSNIADLYVWRMNHATTSDNKESLAREADFAFRQALALDPYIPKIVNAYQNFLKSQNRETDALLLNKMAREFRSRK